MLNTRQHLPNTPFASFRPKLICTRLRLLRRFGQLHWNHLARLSLKKWFWTHVSRRTQSSQKFASPTLHLHSKTSFHPHLLRRNHSRLFPRPSTDLQPRLLRAGILSRAKGLQNSLILSLSPHLRPLRLRRRSSSRSNVLSVSILKGQNLLDILRHF